METREWQPARIWHLSVAVIALIVLITQTGRTALGLGAVEPYLGLRLFHLICYFTIQSNVLVLIAAITLALDPRRDGVWWRAVRAAGIAGITVTAVVHWFLLRPLSTLTGIDFWLDLFLHVVIPLLAVVGWLCFGPRPRMGLRTVGLAVLWPIGWLIGALIHGGLTGWYPYPFLNVPVEGAGPVAVVCVLIALGLFGVLALMALVDRKLPAAPRGRPGDPSSAEVAKEAA